MNTPENKLLFTKNWLICKEVLEEFYVNKIKATCNSKNNKRFYDLTNKKLSRAKLSVMIKHNNDTVSKHIISAEMCAKLIKLRYNNEPSLLVTFSYCLLIMLSAELIFKMI